jgi:hypothetical protein
MLCYVMLWNSELMLRGTHCTVLTRECHSAVMYYYSTEANIQQDAAS